MDIYEATSLLRRGMKDCAYEFGSSTYQDRCDSIDVRASGNTINVYVEMTMADMSYRDEVKENVESTLRSLMSQYDIPFGVDYEINFHHR